MSGRNEEEITLLFPLRASASAGSDEERGRRRRDQMPADRVRPVCINAGYGACQCQQRGNDGGAAEGFPSGRSQDTTVCKRTGDCRGF